MNNIVVQAILLFVFTIPALSQQSSINSILDADDKAEIQKAEDYIKEADAYMEEANQYYLETFEVQADYSLSEKAIQKKIKQLESKAIKKQIEASNLYEKAGKLKYDTYKKYSEKFWKEFEGDESLYTNSKLIEEQAKDLMYQAKTKRSDALKQSDVTLKSTLLNEAYSIENQAVDKQITALSQYYGVETSYVDPIFQPTIIPDEDISDTYETVIPDTYDSRQVTSVTPAQGTGGQGDIAVKQSVVDKYQSYVEDESIPDPLVFNDQGLGNMETFNLNEATAMWNEYQGTEPPEGISETGQVDTITVAEDEYYQDEYVESTDIYEDYSTGTTQDYMVDSQTEKTPDKTPDSFIVESAEHDKEIKTYHIPADEDVIYRVQIAANRAQLSQRALSKMYYGQKSVEMINEEGWFKYSVGDFDTYQEADEFRRRSGVDNAFIVAYRKGTRFTAGSLEEKTHTSTVSSQPMSSGLIFNVQVAASRAPLTKGQIASIYKGDCSVELVEEDGWYKYQIAGFRLYSDALKEKQKTGVKGAFISAYKDGNKLPVKQAIEENKPLVNAIQSRGRRGQVVEVDFNVQIVASKVMLSEDALARIYSGNHPVTLVFEEDWYKYQIKTGSDYGNAKNIRNECGVQKAFIVAYKHGKKQKLYNSIRETGYYP